MWSFWTQYHTYRFKHFLFQSLFEGKMSARVCIYKDNIHCKHTRDTYFCTSFLDLCVLLAEACHDREIPRVVFTNSNMFNVKTSVILTFRTLFQTPWFFHRLLKQLFCHCLVAFANQGQCQIMHFQTNILLKIADETLTLVHVSLSVFFC